MATDHSKGRIARTSTYLANGCEKPACSGRSGSHPMPSSRSDLATSPNLPPWRHPISALTRSLTRALPCQARQRTQQSFSDISNSCGPPRYRTVRSNAPLRSEAPKPRSSRTQAPERPELVAGPEIKARRLNVRVESPIHCACHLGLRRPGLAPPTFAARCLAPTSNPTTDYFSTLGQETSYLLA